jgi:indolepyruvate ferredoxin oxidoreductase beta subunit
LPFRDQSYRAAIHGLGTAVTENLAAYELGQRMARINAGFTAASPRELSAVTTPDAFKRRIEAGFPAPLLPVLTQAVIRLRDYQDDAYAHEYLDRVATLVAAEPAPSVALRLSQAFARGLALWMSFEDTIRVAQVKTRATRRARIHREMQEKVGELVTITEYLKPRTAEILATLPVAIAGHLRARPHLLKWLGSLTTGRRVGVDTIAGYLLLRGVAQLRRWRRRTSRYAEETARIDQWITQLVNLAAVDYALAVEAAENQQLVKGYGETHERGWANFQVLAQLAAKLAGTPGAPDRIRELRAAAVADDAGGALAEALRAAT